MRGNLRGFVFLLSLAVSVSGACYDTGYFCSKLWCWTNYGRNNCKYTCGRCYEIKTTKKPWTPRPWTPKPWTPRPTTPRPWTPRPTTPRPAYLRCGETKFRHARVISGSEAVKGSWPWQVMVQHHSVNVCGGALIRPGWVLTAAHCVYRKENPSHFFSIRAGVQRTNQSEGTEQEITASAVFRHPLFNYKLFYNDIALIKLSRPFIVTNYVNPICLPRDEIRTGSECFLTGWGRTSVNGSRSETLKQAKLRLVDRQTCEDFNRKTIAVPITPSMLCAGSGGLHTATACQGDSGGPLSCRRKYGDQWEVQGVVSFGSPDCKSSETYTVFAGVFKLKGWIDRVIAQNTA